MIIREVSGQNDAHKNRSVGTTRWCLYLFFPQSRRNTLEMGNEHLDNLKGIFKMTVPLDFILYG